MSRLEVNKTYKMYVDGKFIRSESGYTSMFEYNGQSLGNYCLASRKDLRNAIVSARKAQASWASRTAYNRSQILYRLAEILEGRSSQLREEMMAVGLSEKVAMSDISDAIDRVVSYAGWCDKYQQLSSTVNSVASSYFNFSFPEPVGVVYMSASNEKGILSFVTNLCSVIAGGNTCVIAVSEVNPLVFMTFGEFLETSDVPAGVVNLLSGSQAELSKIASAHMDVNALLLCDFEDDKELRVAAADNLKRVISRSSADWSLEEHNNPYYILESSEIKTTWHPIENISMSGASY